MLKEIKLDEIIGKKITGYESSISNGQMIISFSDNTFTTLEVDLGYDPGEEEIIGASLDILDFGNDELIALGIISQTELEAILNKRNAEIVLRRNRRELSEYNRLKVKFAET